MGHWKRITVGKNKFIIINNLNNKVINNTQREMMENWKCCVEELSSVVAQITQGQMISAISALLMPVNTYLTAFHHCWECSA